MQNLYIEVSPGNEPFHVFFSHKCTLFSFRDVNGELLYEIKKMQKDAPESFYGTLRNELGFDFVTVLKFTRALDRI